MTEKQINDLTNTIVQHMENSIQGNHNINYCTCKGCELRFELHFEMKVVASKN